MIDDHNRCELVNVSSGTGSSGLSWAKCMLNMYLWLLVFNVVLCQNSCVFAIKFEKYGNQNFCHFKFLCTCRNVHWLINICFLCALMAKIKKLKFYWMISSRIPISIFFLVFTYASLYIIYILFHNYFVVIFITVCNTDLKREDVMDCIRSMKQIRNDWWPR